MYFFLASLVTTAVNRQRCNLAVIKMRTGCSFYDFKWASWYDVGIYSALLNIPLQTATTMFGGLTFKHSSPYVKRTTIIKENAQYREGFRPSFHTCLLIPPGAAKKFTFTSHEMGGNAEFPEQSWSNGANVHFKPWMQFRHTGTCSLFVVTYRPLVHLECECW